MAYQDLCPSLRACQLCQIFLIGELVGCEHWEAAWPLGGLLQAAAAADALFVHLLEEERTFEEGSDGKLTADMIQRMPVRESSSGGEYPVAAMKTMCA